MWIVLTAVGSGALGGLLALLQSPRPTLAEDVGTVGELARLERVLAEIETAQTSLSESDRDASLAEPRSAAPAFSQDELDRALEAWVARQTERAAELARKEATRARPRTAFSVHEKEVSELIKLVADAAGDEVVSSQLWAELIEAKRDRELLAAIETWIGEQPPDAEMVLFLGVSQFFAATAQDQALRRQELFDQSLESLGTVLEMDPGNDDARFLRAITLALQPPVKGRTGEAIQELENLTRGPMRNDTSGQYANAWLYLGNLYQQTGRSQKALDTWREALQMYPDNMELLRQVRTHDR